MDTNQKEFLIKFEDHRFSVNFNFSYNLYR